MNSSRQSNMKCPGIRLHMSLIPLSRYCIRNLKTFGSFLAPRRPISQSTFQSIWDSFNAHYSIYSKKTGNTWPRICDRRQYIKEDKESSSIFQNSPRAHEIWGWLCIASSMNDGQEIFLQVTLQMGCVQATGASECFISSSLVYLYVSEIFYSGHPPPPIPWTQKHQCSTLICIAKNKSQFTTYQWLYVSRRAI